MKLQVDSYCWCASEEVSIPVDWVRAGQTASCKRPACGPGCIVVADEPEESPAHPRRVYSMAKFKPETYDPTRDSSAGCRPQAGVVSLIMLPGLCKCGCEEEVIEGNHFRMGHDARLKGILVRAEATGSQIHLIDPELGIHTVVGPLEFASEFSTDNCDWPALVLRSAGKYRQQEVLAGVAV